MKIPRAIPPRAAEEMAEALWRDLAQRFHVRRRDRATGVLAIAQRGGNLRYSTGIRVHAVARCAWISCVMSSNTTPDNGCALDSDAAED